MTSRQDAQFLRSILETNPIHGIHDIAKPITGFQDKNQPIAGFHDVTEPMNGPHGNSVHSDAVVHVDVLDANDHAPKFLSRKLEAQITEEDGRHLPRVVLTVSTIYRYWFIVKYVFIIMM